MWDREVRELLDVLNEGFPAVHEMTGAEARKAVAARRAPVPNLDDVARTDDLELPGTAGPIRARLYVPHGEPEAPRPIVVFLHGGGFVFCDIETHDGFCRQLARGTDSLVLSVDYRLAPEHPAPAAADDAFAAVRWAVEHAEELGGDPSRVVTAGDSAGGNLACVVTLMARDAGGPPLAGQVLIYPVVDPACATDSYDRYAEGYFNTAAAMRWYWQQYLGDGRTPEPPHHVEPLRAADLSGLPPALIVSAALDPLVDEARVLGERLRADGVRVLHREYGGLFHGFLTILALQAAQSARDVLWRDLRDLLGVPRPAPAGNSVDREGASA